MLLIYTILYFLSMMFYYLNCGVIASIIMILLAIFLCVVETMSCKRIINIRGLFALGFIGGFGISLLKLSKLSSDYSVITFLAVFIAYFSLYFGAFLEDKRKINNELKARRMKLERRDVLFISQEILLIVMIVVTFLSFVLEVAVLKFIPLFTIDTPHAYSIFHIFMVHYITTFYAFIPAFAISNYLVEPNRKQSKIFVIISFIYMIIMSLLLVSRSKLFLSVVLSLFIIIINKTTELKRPKFNRKNILKFAIAIFVFLILYLIITINRAHDVDYLNSIFEMKNDELPIFISQPYMYIAHNYENLNYMINNIFRWTFGRRILYPFFTLTMVKKFFPIVVDSPYYIIKEELSTVTIIYDFYYDFGLVGVAVFCFLIGYIGKKLENITYRMMSGEIIYKNNYITILFSLYSYFMLSSFFQAYFSLTDTWVYITILLLFTLFFTMTRVSTKKNPIDNKSISSNKKMGSKSKDYEEIADNIDEEMDESIEIEDLDDNEEDNVIYSNFDENDDEKDYNINDYLE